MRNCPPFWIAPALQKNPIKKKLVKVGTLTRIVGVYVAILRTVVSFGRSEPLRSWGFRLQSSPTVVAFSPSERLLKSDCGGRGGNPRNCRKPPGT